MKGPRIRIPVKHKNPRRAVSKTDASFHLRKTSTANMFRFIMLAILVDTGLTMACGRRGLPQDDYSVYEDIAWALVCETNRVSPSPTVLLSNLNLAIQLAPDKVHTESYNLRAICWGMIGDMENARRDYMTVIAQDPNNPKYAPTYCALANIMTMESNHIKALEYVNQSIALDPNYGMAHYMKTMIYSRMGMIEEAKEELRLAIELDPQVTNAIHASEFITIPTDSVKDSGP